MSEPKQVLPGTLLEYTFLDDDDAGFLDLKSALVFSRRAFYTKSTAFVAARRCPRFYLKPAQLDFWLRVESTSHDAPASSWPFR